MTEQEQTKNTAPPLKKVKRIKAVVAGKFRVIHQPGSAFEETRLRLIQQGLVVHKTSHFLFVIGQEDQPTILVHRLSAHEVDNNIGYYLMRELAPRGLITSDKDFGAALIAVVISIAPQNPVEAWNLFSLNTLQRLREKLNDLSSSTGESDFIIPFAHIYHRLLQLKVGSSLLDVGCACAFWPVLVAEYAQTPDEKIIGVDSRSDAVALSNNLASAANMTHIEFLQVLLQLSECLS